MGKEESRNPDWTDEQNADYDRDDNGASGRNTGQQRRAALKQTGGAVVRSASVGKKPQKIVDVVPGLQYQKASFGSNRISVTPEDLAAIEAAKRQLESK